MLNQQLLKAILNKFNTHTPKPLIIGISGAQGSGKTTFAKEIKQALINKNIKSLILSLDDFYLTKKERVELATSTHPLLITRGVPGTHNISLLINTINNLKKGVTTQIPVFDKSIDDRKTTITHTKKVDIILLEGWCLGATPQTKEELKKPINSLEKENDPHLTWRQFVNNHLKNNYKILFNLIDYNIFIKVPSFSVVYNHRLEQETKDNKAMSSDQIKTFIAHFERLTQHMQSDMPQHADIVIEIDEKRNVRNIIS